MFLPARFLNDWRLQTRKWTDNAGVERWTTEIMVKQQGTMQMLGSSSRTNTSGNGQVIITVPWARLWRLSQRDLCHFLMMTY